MPKTEKDKIENPEKKIEDYTLESGILAERFTEKEITIDGCIFTIRALPEVILAFAADAGYFEGQYNGTLHILNTCRFGIIDIKPLKGKKLLDNMKKKVDVEKEVVSVLGMRWETISFAIIRRLKMQTLKKLFMEIVNHSKMSDEEADSLDFTTDSEPSA